MARIKGGQRLVEMARRSRQKKAAEPKSRVAGEPKFRLGPVSPEEPYEAFESTVAPESPGLLKKLLSKLTEGRDYSQPVEPHQKRLEKELGEARKLLEKIEKTLSEQSREPEPLPSELPGHKEEVAQRVKGRRVEEDAKWRKIREQFAPIRVENIPELKEELPKPRQKEKKERAAEAVETVTARPLESAFMELEAATMKQFPYPKDDQQMIDFYGVLARAFEKELGAPDESIRNKAVHTLIHSRVDPAFNKFFDNLALKGEGGEPEVFTEETEVLPLSE